MFEKYYQTYDVAIDRSLKELSDFAVMYNIEKYFENVSVSEPAIKSFAKIKIPPYNKSKDGFFCS